MRSRSRRLAVLFVTFLALSAACSQMGAVAVPINWHSRGRELEHVLSHSGARSVFVHSDLIPPVEEALPAGVGVPARGDTADPAPDV